MALTATLYTDPSCPWAYSARPALNVLRWRYGDGIGWQLVTIGLSETTDAAIARGFTPEGRVAGHLEFRRRFGMPFTTQPSERLVASGRACRAIVATRLRHPGREFAVLRALQLAWFNTTALLDEDAALEAVLERVDGVDAGATIAALDSQEVEAAYQEDRVRARSAAGSPSAAQGKAREVAEGVVRYSAP